MKHRNPLLYATVASFLILIITGIMYVSAQQTLPPLDQSANMTDLEQRIYQLEVQQAQYIEALKISNDSYKSGMTVFGIVVGAFVSISLILQGSVFYFQYRREGQRESRENKRVDERASGEKERGSAETKGVEQVSKVMSLVEQTLKSRLDAETKSGEKIKALEEKIDTIISRNNVWNRIIETSRESIEKKAEELATQTSRQGFKSRTADLSHFSDQFDEFQRNYSALAEKKFSPRVPYVRGIAAHFTNLPNEAKNYLSEATIFNQAAVEGETENDRAKRMANSYYFLGLIESNFGNYDNAIINFDNAKPETQKDFLTMIAAAEAYLMNNQYQKAIDLISIIKATWQEDPKNNDRRMLSRAILMEASIPIMKREKGWAKKAYSILKPVHDADPLYYFATATLGQLCFSDNNFDVAKQLFSDASDKIEHSGDLFKGTEVRVKIHLLMVAGMCCLYGSNDSDRAVEYLNNAKSHLAALPQIGLKTCTVFSNISKRNEKREEIEKHIKLIKERKEVFL